MIDQPFRNVGRRPDLCMDGPVGTANVPKLPRCYLAAELVVQRGCAFAPAVEGLVGLSARGKQGWMNLAGSRRADLRPADPSESCGRGRFCRASPEG